MSTYEVAKLAALALIRSLVTGDRELFEQTAGGIDEDVRSMLQIWLAEVLSGQYSIFTADDSFGFTSEQGRQLYRAMARYPDARAHIGLRAALEPLVGAWR